MEIRRGLICGKFYPSQSGRDVLTETCYYGHFYLIFMFGLHEKKVILARLNPAYLKTGSCLSGTFCIYIRKTKTGLFFIQSRQYKCASPANKLDFLGSYFKHFLPKKKRERQQNCKSKTTKQHFTSSGKVLDDLIIRLENFKALMEFKAQYFDGDINTQ